MLLLLASVVLLGSSTLLLTALLSWVVLLTMLSLCSWLGPGLGRGGALLELLPADLVAVVEDTLGFSVLTPVSRLTFVDLETLVVLIGGVGGPPGRLAVVFKPAPLLAEAASIFLPTGGVGSFLAPALLEAALVTLEVSL